MEKNCKPFLKLSSSEIENLISEQRRKWKIFRLQQVRAQSREKALALVKTSAQEEKRQKALLKEQLEKKWLNNNEKKLHSLVEDYEHSLLKFGEAHKRAEKEKSVVEAHQQKQFERNKWMAKCSKEAFQRQNKMKTEAAKKEAEIRLRKSNILEKEKRRANNIAKMPTPPRFKPPRKSPVRPKKVKFYEAGTFTTSSYVPSSVQIVKENLENESNVDARFAAKQEREKHELAQNLKALKEKEDGKKIHKRATVARQKERMRKMYSELMSDLEKVDEDDLSGLWQGSDTLLEKSDEASGEECTNREEVVEKRVEQLLQEDTESEEIQGLKWKREMVGMFDFQVASEERHSPPDINSGDVLRVTDEVHPQDPNQQTQGLQENEADDKVDFSATSKDPSSFEPELAQFKETVSVHDLPIFKEKFKYHSKSSLLESSHPAESSQSQSSFEEIKVKIDFLPGFDCRFPSPSKDSSSDKISSSSSITQYMSCHLQNAEIVTRNKRLPTPESQSIPSSSTESCQTRNISTTDEDRSMWDNLRQIQESRRKIKDIIDELKKRPSHKEVDKKTTDKDFQMYRTPPRIYKEPLKTESSGKKPQTRRQKFEIQKQMVLQRYIEKLMQMKQEELSHLTASSVGESGINISSDKYLEKLIEKNVDHAFPNFSPIESRTLQPCIDEVDIIPTKLSSISSTVSDGSTVRDISMEEFNDLSPFVSDSSSANTVQIQKQQILMRMIQLQKLKRQLIIQRQMALRDDTKELIHMHSIVSSSDHLSPSTESSIEWSSTTTYQTPSREDSTLSKTSKGAPSSPILRPPVPDDQAGQSMTNQKQSYIDVNPHTEHISKVHSQNSALYPELELESRPTYEPDNVSGKEGADYCSSSGTSLPDMTQILKNFGLSWAVSMIKKMDIADGDTSENTSQL